MLKQINLDTLHQYCIDAAEILNTIDHQSTLYCDISQWPRFTAYILDKQTKYSVNIEPNNTSPLVADLENVMARLLDYKQEAQESEQEHLTHAEQSLDDAITFLNNLD